MSMEVPDCWSDGSSSLPAGDTWRAYWERIEDRQHVFRIEAADYAQRVLRLLQPSPTMRVLDFGCGFGHTARALAPHVGKVALWDASAAVRRQARERVRELSNVQLLDLESAAGRARCGRFDLILVHSVLQYMEEQEIRDWLARWRELLAPEGRLVLSDLIVPGSGGQAELLEYLAFARRNGFFWNAAFAGARELVSYFNARRTRPLTVIQKQHLERWADEARLSLQWLPENLSHRSARGCAMLRSV